MPALDGMRILDMTQYEAGTSCTQMLAWLGAEVVKVEPPRGDPGRTAFSRAGEDSQYFLNYNSNKRSIVLDLTTDRGRGLLLDLVPRFDVFVENYGPGVVEKLDIGYNVLSALHPSIIYARVKGYGLSGPYAHYKCFDPLAQAAAGALSVTGDPDGPPVKPGPTVADTGTGMQTALAITAAWAQKLRTGEGQLIEVSMQEAMTMFMRTTSVLDWAQRPARRSRWGKRLRVHVDLHHAHVGPALHRDRTRRPAHRRPLPDRAAPPSARGGAGRGDLSVDATAYQMGGNAYPLRGRRRGQRDLRHDGRVQ
jgi:formyl-CoA transferase